MSQRPPDDWEPDAEFDDGDSGDLAGPPDFMRSRGWRWAVYGVSTLVVLALLLPALLFACNSGSGAARPTGTNRQGGSAIAPDRQLAPDFQLTSAAGASVRLYDVVDEHGSVVLVFYRGLF